MKQHCNFTVYYESCLFNFNVLIFQGGPYHDPLQSLLAAYVCYRPDVGYVSLNLWHFEVIGSDQLIVRCYRSNSQLNNQLRNAVLQLTM